MKTMTMFKSAMLMAMLVLGFVCIGGTSAYAQPGCIPAPCKQYWVNYNYVYPPATGPINVNVHWQSGWVDVTSSTIDGHFTYPENPAWGSPTGICINNQWIPIPAVGPLYYISDPSLPPGLCLEVEVRCTPCLEIRVHVGACNPNPPDYQNPSPFPC
ncbi:MAG: hypothetical protein JWQ98_3299 [Chlorobi bacterium]|nr:hypothetical protein [Chlorobiota bacterium]